MEYLENQEQWVNLHKQKRYRPKYPAELVVQYGFRNFEPGSRILDAGCGGGRHVLFMAREGMVPYGLDFSSSGVDYTKSLLTENGYSQFAGNIVTAGCDDMPFDDNSFDGLISFGVLYYLPFAKIQASVMEFHRVLKPGGKCLVIVRSLEDYRFMSGEKTDERHTVRIAETAKNRSAASENGMLMHFFDREELAGLFADFHDVTIDEQIITHDDGAYRDDDYVLTASKSLRKSKDKR